MKILLNYFKPSGKWYAQGETEADDDDFYKAVGLVGALIKARCLPGLRSGHSNFVVHMTLEGSDLPHVFLPSQEPDIIQYLRGVIDEPRHLSPEEAETHRCPKCTSINVVFLPMLDSYQCFTCLTTWHI